jgi:hypothetical protein
MTREELECAMPAEKILLEFEAGLVRRILNDVRDEPGNLPCAAVLTSEQAQLQAIQQRAHRFWNLY